MSRFLVCPACGYHDPSAGAAGEVDAGDDGDGGGEDDTGDNDDGGDDDTSDDGDGKDDAGGGDGHRCDGDGDATSMDDWETPDCPRCGSRRTYRHDDPAPPDAETEAYVKFDAEGAGER